MNNLQRHYSIAKMQWIDQCAIQLRKNKPEISEEEAIESAGEIWLAARFSLTPEAAADLASGLMKRYAKSSSVPKGDEHANWGG